MISNRSSRKGFTLIELLVVIAIIAILAAILFPVFAKAREKARQTSCSSNMKQLGIGFAQYVQDFDEKQPYGNTGGPTNGKGGEVVGWAADIYNYVKSTGVYKCPDDPGVVSGANVPLSYAMNANLANSLTLAQFTSPARTVQLFEVSGITGDPTAAGNIAGASGNGNNATTGGVITPGTPGTFAVGTTSYAMQTTGIFQTGYLNYSGATTNVAPYNNGLGGLGWHTDGANYLFGDSHVKWIKPNNMYAGLNDTATDCGSTGATAASVACTIATMAGTFSYN